MGIEPLLEKLRSLQDMPPPRNPKQVKQFLGLAWYHRTVVLKFADISQPQTSLTKKDIPFERQKLVMMPLMC